MVLVGGVGDEEGAWRKVGVVVKGSMRGFMVMKLFCILTVVVNLLFTHMLKFHRIKYTCKWVQVKLRKSNKSRGLYQCYDPACESDYSLARYYYRGKLSKSYLGSLCSISYNFTWIFNDLEVKTLISRSIAKKSETTWLSWLPVT